MCYIHTFEIDYNNSILFAYENNRKSGRLDFELQNENVLKIIDFKSGCNDPNYYQGTKMILYLLNDIKVPIKRIHGVLSTEDAKTEYIELEANSHKLVGWQVSIPFYAGLTRYIPNSKFILYDGMRDWKNDITEEYNYNSTECIDKLIIANNNCSFDIIIDHTF